MNKVILKGNSGQDPRITTFADGGKVAQLTLATNERFKNRDGNITEKTTWHNLVVKRSALADLCEKYVRKGTPLLIEGKLDNRRYSDANGVEHYITEIIVINLELLGGNRQQDAPAPEPEDDMPADI